MSRAWALAPLLALLALVGVGAYVLLNGAERETVSAGLVGEPAPRVELARLRGGTLSIADANQGAPYLINLFASWCTPCRAEHRHLMALKRAGVTVYGIAYKDAPEKSAAFLEELGDPYADVVLDPAGRFGLELGVTGVPETFVIGADGRIRAIHRGPLSPEIVQDAIMPALHAP